MLVLDTASAETSAALFAGENCLSEKTSRRPNSHNEEISSLVATVLKNGDMPADSLNCLLCTVGPGSFTGLRIGCSFLKGISFALRIPLYGISSLRAYASEFKDRARLIAAVSDARRNEYFCGIYTKTDCGALKPLIDDSIMSKDAFLFELEQQKRHSKADGEIMLASLCGELAAGQDYRLEQPKQVAFSAGKEFLSMRSESLSYGIDSLAGFQLSYLRAVAAKTIVERERERGS